MAKTQSLPPRSKVARSDTWDLTKMYASAAKWEADLARFEGMLAGFKKFKGKLADAKTLLKCLQHDATVDRLAEKIGVYAFLNTAGDQTDSNFQRMKGRYGHVSTQAAEAAAFIRPEILAIDPATMQALLSDPVLKDWKLALDRVVRYRKHTLTPNEERLLAMQGQAAAAASSIFTQLNNADLKWPAIEDEKGQSVELGHSSYSKFLISPKRSVRKNAFHTFYAQFDAHKNTLAASLNGSLQRDAYNAKARGYKSSLDHALFPDNVPAAVYDNLISTVRTHLPTLHRYYELRQRAMKLKDLHFYDTYVPIVGGVEKHHTWEQASNVVVDALQPLGEEYCSTLAKGLSSERWCDRYPNAGKQSGAFSYGTFDALPYIMMNYQPSVLDHVFTLAHEAGHSMHSWRSVRGQPYQYYNYVIFVAEVASTFNEQLLLKHMLDRTQNKKERAYLLNHAIDEIRGTIVRQTMFAEFEQKSHALVESGEPLTVEAARKIYRELLIAYFGPGFVIDDVLELECLRIPHFYRAFYVYKYATGLSAAIALSERVLSGGDRETQQYLNFLSGGSSKDPLDLLRDAGVDMRKPAPVAAAMKRMAGLLDELETLL